MGLINTLGKEELYIYYVEQNKTIKEISKTTGLSTSTVFNYLKKYGIKTRKVGFNGKKHSQEAKRKISDKNKGRVFSTETKKKMADSAKVGGIGHKKTRKDGYVSVYFPDHPKSSKDGYIMEHILVMECIIGRWLEPDEVVHHINHVRNDNRAENLLLLSRKEHMRMHTYERQHNGGIPHRTIPVKNINTGEVYNSVKEAAESINVSPTNVSKVCRHIRENTKGQKFEYLVSKGAMTYQ